MDNRKLFEFLREADDVAVWLKERAAIAGSDDYGTDLEHVEVSTSTGATHLCSLMLPCNKTV